MPSPMTTSMWLVRLLRTTTSIVWPLSVIRTLIFSGFMRRSAVESDTWPWSGLLGHRRRMMARNQPLAAVPLVRVRVARLHLTSIAERECVEPDIDCRVAVDFNGARVDLADRLVLEKVLEVILLLVRRHARRIGNGRQQHRRFGVIRHAFLRIPRPQRAVPAIEE